MDFTPDYTKNVSYDPEAWGLKVVANISQPDLSWEFDEYIVWIDTEGNVFYAQDSGCSCPTPFEDYNSIEQLGRLTEQGFESFRDGVRGWYSGGPAELTRFFTKVLTAVTDPEGSKLAEEEVAAYLERKAKEEAAEQESQEHFKRVAAVNECAGQLNKAGALDRPRLLYRSEWPIGRALKEMEGVDLADVMVFAHYLGTLATVQMEQLATLGDDTAEAAA